MLELFRGRSGRVAGGLLVGEVATATQMLVVAAIMPQIVGDLHGLDVYGFASGAFVLANFISLPFAGPLADRIGLRRIFGIAMLLVAAGVIAASLSQTMAQFVGARALEGLGAGFDYAVSFTAIAKTFEEDARTKMFALISGAWLVPALVGPAAGAALATSLGWRWAFAAFLPLLAAAALLALPALPRSRGDGDADPFGAVRMLFSGATLRLARGMHASFAAFALMHAAFFGADAYVSLMIVSVRGAPLQAAALCVTLGAVGWSAMSAVQPRLLQRIGAQRVVLIGCLAGAAALAGVIACDVGAPLWLVFASWCVGGAGIGLSYPTISVTSLENVPSEREGTVSSATLLAAMLGSSAGILLGGLPVTLAAHVHAPLSTALVVTFALAAVPLVVLAVIRSRISAS